MNDDSVRKPNVLHAVASLAEKVKEVVESEPVQEAVENPRMFVGKQMFSAMDFLRREMLRVRIPEPPDEKELQKLEQKLQKKLEAEAKRQAKLLSRLAK